MKIIIVGAGIGGLTTYLYLKKLLTSSPKIHITIYEKHATSQPSSSSSFDKHNNEPRGAALGIAPNGLAVLQDLDPALCEEVIASGYPITRHAMRTANGRRLGWFRATNYSEPVKPTILISRQRLWECLRKRVPDTMIINNKVMRVSCAKDAKPIIHTSTSPEGNGSTAVTETEADLIIGADGMHSIVKKAVTGDGDRDDYPPIYSGLAGIGGFVPSSLLSTSYKYGELCLTFSGSGFFGFGPTTRATTPSIPLSSPSLPNPTAPGLEITWWSSYTLPTAPTKSDAIDPDDVKAQLLSRHKTWRDPTITAILAHLSKSSPQIDSIYPTYTTPELPYWSKNGSVVLLGDAAHAMPSSSGQGASQAMEDAQVFAMLLAHYLADSTVGTSNDTDNDNGAKTDPSTAATAAISSALTRYETIRKPRVKKIVERAEKMSGGKKDMSWWQEMVMYAVIWVMGTVLPFDVGELGELYEDLPGRRLAGELVGERESMGGMKGR